MKKIKNFLNNNLSAIAFVLVMGSIALFSSCKEDPSGTPSFSTGTPKITSARLLDTLAKHKDSLIVSSEPNKLIVISGQNIGGVLKVYFNGYSTTFNPTYNTDINLIITVPSQAPVDSTADNKIRLVTSHGEAVFNFKIIAKPAVYSYDKNTFGADRGDITLTGKNFSDVSSVVFSGTTTAVKIVSKTKDKIGNETIVLRFPTSTVGQTALDITNSSGTITTTNSFVNADVALKIFTEDFGKDFANNSWGDGLIVNSDQAYAGKKSASKNYGGGGWGMAAFSNWYPSVDYTPDYTHFAFAIKGGSVDIPLWITTDAGKSSFGNDYVDKNQIIVPAKIWTYYKIPLKDLDFWLPGKTMKQLGWRVKGPDKNENLYFDEVMLIKK